MIAIGLEGVRNAYNVGSTMRAAQCFGASIVVIAHGRAAAAPTDTGKGWRRIPIVRTEDAIIRSTPYGATPIAVEVREDTVPLPEFKHPKRAFYIFGPEDGSVARETMDRVPLVVTIPAAFCLNLAMAVNVVLYDRAAKMGLPRHLLPWKQRASGGGV
jgi:tRNA(Leu) C34 or U34 (ribose-2'-O)-methylase TrmL